MWNQEEIQVPSGPMTTALISQGELGDIRIESYSGLRKSIIDPAYVVGPSSSQSLSKGMALLNVQPGCMCPLQGLTMVESDNLIDASPSWLGKGRYDTVPAHEALPGH